MGKGDKRTKRGKIWRGSYGKLRPKEPKAKQPLQPPAKQSPQPPAKPPARSGPPHG